MMKPAWLNKKISLRDCVEVKTLLKDLHLNTVCEEAKNRMPLDVDVDGAVWSWVIRPVEKL